MPNILVGISGSLGILSMPSYLAIISAHFPNLKIIMTYSATHFIPIETLAIFTQGAYTNEFPLSQENMGHIELSRWADLFVVLPTTAHLLSMVAHGAADSLLSATILAYKGKILFFPNMNSAMWENQAVQKNVRLVQEYGHKIIPPIKKTGFEAASKTLETNPVMPSIESVISILKLHLEIGEKIATS